MSDVSVSSACSMFCQHSMFRCAAGSAYPLCCELGMIGVLQTYTAWCNAYLSQRDIRVVDLSADLSNGVALCTLIEVISTRPTPSCSRTHRRTAASAVHIQCHLQIESSCSLECPSRSINGKGRIAPNGESVARAPSVRASCITVCLMIGCSQSTLCACTEIG